MNHTPNLIAVAVTAAGGVDVVADHFKLTRPAVYYWIRKNVLPTKYVRQLCVLSRGVVSTDALLDYMERVAEPPVVAA
jgi:hypothetical protein